MTTTIGAFRKAVESAGDELRDHDVPVPDRHGPALSVDVALGVRIPKDGNPLAYYRMTPHPSIHTDLKLLRAAGHDHPDMKKIEALLGIDKDSH